MRDPKGYQQVNSIQTRDVEVILQEFPTEWKEKNAKIIDIGCGDGSVTMNIWKKFIPENFMKIVGSDKSQTCVDFARQRYKSERVEFIKLDIEEEVPIEMYDSFDHVISSYTFHWVHCQETAFSNIYNMLAKDGSCLIIFLGHANIFDNYRVLSYTQKWSTDLKNVKTKFISPYHDSQDPENEITSLMKKIGFRNINVQVHHKTFDFVGGVEEFKKLMKCLNPFDSLNEKWDDFMNDYVNLDPEAGTCIYQLLVVYGVK